MDKVFDWSITAEEDEDNYPILMLHIAVIPNDHLIDEPDWAKQMEQDSKQGYNV